ncbi:MAG: hypothetical protein ACYTFA_06205 [Planctomycetota bacterium]|jgi:hypothetical protein
MSRAGEVPSRSTLFQTLVILAGVVQLQFAGGARGDEFDQYALTGSFDLPGGADVFDVLTDGRIIVLVDADVYVEDDVGSRAFALRGTLPDAGDLPYPAFVRVSPDGASIAVGDNTLPGRVGVFDLGTLSGVWFAASHFDAEWYDDTHLAISGADANAITLLDTTSADPLNPTNPLIIDDTGFSAGITFDAAGNLYTGNGYGDGPVYTGEVRVFDNTSWTAVPDGGTPLDFLNDGTLVVDILSAASLGFDREGNLHVGGGDIIGGTDVDFAALVRASAVSDALIGLGAAVSDDPQEVRRDDPDDENDSNFYSITYDPVRAELYFLSYGETTVYTYAVSPQVPAASEWGIVTAVLLLMTAGTIVIRLTQRTTHFRPEPPNICRGRRALRTDHATGYTRFGVVVLLGSFLLPNPAAGDPWADEVVDAAAALDGTELYNDPLSVLGMPATTFYDNFFTFQQFYVSLAAGPFNLDAPDGDKLITTINAGQYIKVRFDGPVEDDPRNPFGIDLIVFGNSFLVGSGLLTSTTDMETHYLTSGIFPEFVTVAVSPTGVGDPQTHPEHWHVYDSGPFADSLYPTNAYLWDREAHDWGDPLDFTTPVDPSRQLTDFAGHSVADAIDMYECSAGGTGYDLSESGFDSITYVYLTSTGGEVDALSDVFSSLGDFDRDGDVDLRDLAQFQNCFYPEREVPFPCGCRSADFDGGLEVDLTDYASISTFVTGPS